MSDFSFKDRYRLVKEGTKDLSRLCVVPSGRFIISKETFRSYFKKDTEQKIVDVSKDVWIFAQYIAKKLNIKKRFVGEEPTDYVTNLYNQEMKKIFPLYGIEIEEIPRKKIGDQVISAKYVRNRYKEKDWKALKKLVPYSTLAFLKEYREPIQKRTEIKTTNLYGREIKKKICEFIRCHDSIIMYGIGRDASAIYDFLDTPDKNKIEFCDQKANDREIIFKGKTVIEPSFLKKRYEGYYILISSSLYGRQIFDSLLRSGIDANCIYVNTLSADLWKS